MTAHQTMLITGGGNGRAAALAFARAGYNVIVTDIFRAERQEISAAIRSACGSA